MVAIEKPAVERIDRARGWRHARHARHRPAPTRARRGARLPRRLHARAAGADAPSTPSSATSSAGRAARASAADYGAAVERARGHAATLLGTTADRVAIGSQVSVFAGLVAASAPAGAEVLCVDGDFSSIVGPSSPRGDLRVRHVPLAELADADRPPSTWLVSFSLVQSATGEVADAASAITAAARAHGARTLCDTTQATGWMPADRARRRP